MSRRRGFALLALVLAGCASERAGEPGAPVTELEFDFADAQSIATAHLEALVLEELGSRPDPDHLRALVDDAAWSISELYRGQGFADAEVTWELEGSLARIRIDEGPRIELVELTFDGASAFDAQELEELYTVTQPADEALRSRPYVERALRNLTGDVRALYVGAGWLRCEVSLAEVRLHEPAGEARARFLVREGPACRLREFELSGIDGELGLELRASVGKSLGETYTSRLARTLATRMQEVLGQRGHPDARVELARETIGDDGSTALLFEIAAGPRVRITSVEVRGLSRVDREIVVSRLELAAGDAWSAERAQTSLSELYRSGLFTSVDVRLDGTGEERTLVVEVHEAPSRELWIEPGWGSYERARLGVGWRDKNWLDSGRRLDLDATLADRAQRARAALTDLRLFGSEVEGGLSLFAGRREEPSFTTTEWGGALSFKRRLAEHLQAILTFTLRRSGVEDVDLSLAPASVLDKSVDIASITLAPSFDDRDNLLAPRAGSLARLSVEFASSATGSELDFLRGNWTGAHFWSLSADSVLGVGLRGGVIVPIDDTDVIPLQERFLNGGENSVRAFREGEVGPTQNGEPLGGEAFHVASIELRHWLSGNFEGALFVDAGNVVSRHEDTFDLDGMRWGPGVGLRYLLPVGPIRLDGAWNVDSRPGESHFVLHLSVGLSF